MPALILTLLIFILTGCKREAPKSELVNKVYLDLQGDIAVLEKTREEILKDIDGKKAQIARKDISDHLRSGFRKQFSAMNIKFIQVDQTILFLKIRANKWAMNLRRESEAAAFKVTKVDTEARKPQSLDSHADSTTEKSDLPDHVDFESMYFKNKHLRFSPREWSGPKKAAAAVAAPPPAAAH